MNNGRPNQGNPNVWGQQPGQQNQQTNWQQRPGAQGGYQQPWQQPYQQQRYQPRPNPMQPGQQPPYQRQPYPGTQQQPYQQGFQQPNYSQVNQAPYQQGYRPQQQKRQPQPQQPQQNTYYGPAYPGQPYPGYPQQYPAGYPQQPQQQKQKKPFDPAVILWVMLCGVLPVLFVLGLVMSSLSVLKWVFVGLAVVTVACLWIKPVLPPNARLTFSGVYGALAVVALVSALTAAPAADNTNAAANGGNAAQGALTGSQSQQQQQMPASSADASLGGWSTEIPVATSTPQPDGLQSAAVKQMESFFDFWSVNNQDNMVSLCAPSWRKSVQEPKVKLFSILANRTPVEYTSEKITGTENDTARTVTVTALINKNNGKDPEKYRFQVIMVKEDNQWYVDPASLESHETVTTTAPIANETATPTAEFIASANTVLYYNANGGERYHLDAYCKSANEKYLPFKGQFYFSQLSEPAYKDLVACNVCGAPLRQ